MAVAVAVLLCAVRLRQRRRGGGARGDDRPGGTGLASCQGTVASGARIDTAAAGPHTFTVTARDVAGNAGTTIVHYAVVAPAPPTISIKKPATGARFAKGQRVIASYK